MMNPRQNDSYRNSDLNRAKPKKGALTSLIDSNLKRHRSDTGLVEDRMKNTTVVRIIVALLLVHMLIIGGVLVRDDLVRSVKTDVVSPTLTQPPAPQSVIPQPVQPTMAQSTPAATATVPEPTPVQPIVTAPVQPVPTAPAAPVATPQAPSTITSAPPAEAIAVEPEVKTVTPVVAQPEQTTPAAPAEAPSRPTKHYVRSGDTWGHIVEKYNVSTAMLMKANPGVKPSLLVAGTYLLIPDKDGNVPSELSAKRNKAPVKIYKVKSGDTLSLIAKRHGISMQKLLEYNNMTRKEAARIHVGQEIRLSE